MLIFVAGWFSESRLVAQPSALPKIVDVQVGFKPHEASRLIPTHKVGLWTPVSVRVLGGAVRYENTTGDDSLSLVLECEDSEDCLTITRLPIALDAGAEKTVVAYIKPGQTRGDLRVWLETPSGVTIPGPTIERATSNLGDYLYLSLGAKLDELAAGLSLKEKKAAEEGKTLSKANRFALFENDPARLPDRWLGYDGIDLAILNSTDAGFLDGLLKLRRLEPLLHWVTYGGRLVIPMHHERMDRLASFLDSSAAKDGQPWPTFPAKSLVNIETFSGLQNKPFPPRGQLPALVTRFDPSRFGKTWETQPHLEDPAAGDKPLPLIARVSRGYGSITFIAFPLDAGAFTNWSGQAEFFRSLVDQFGPRYALPEKGREALWGAEVSVSDWGAQLQRKLDNFDVPTPSFGAVAFYMFAYILLVSALDYLLLRRVIGKLEATWVTLPLMVVGVSLGVFSIVNSPSDKGVMVNQIDLLDLDLSGPRARPGGARPGGETAAVHGTTFFAARSDTIRAWDVDIREPSRSRTTLSWFGRADDGPGGMGRAGGSSLSPKTYRFDERHGFPQSVPFAFRATKAFSGEWLSTDDPPPPPLTADLKYHPREHLLKVSGTISNRLPFDLAEADLFVFDRVYSIPGGLKKDEDRRIEIKEIDNGMLPSDWRERAASGRPITTRGTYDPGVALRNILFHERLDPQLKIRNHVLRRLDWSWRLREDPRFLNQPLSTLGTREAILVARARFQSGDAKALADDPSTLVRVVLQSGPDDKTWPGSAGRWARDTFVRVILPLRPQQ